MLTILSAPRFEDLERHLIDRLMQPGNPLAADTVLVPSAAVRRRLALAIADRHGVCAQVEFGFLAQWLWLQIARILPGVPRRSPYDPAVLRWRMAACLADQRWTRAHPRLAGYLAAGDAVDRFQLADRLARLYDQYLTYRPDWLAAWSVGTLRASRSDDAAARADERWQAELWRQLHALAGQAGADPAGAGASRHPGHAFLAALDEHQAAGAEILLPARIQVFALPTMAPLYLELLAGLANHCDVDLYVLNPCREYWFDLVSQRELARRVCKGEAEHLEVGHRLLSAWGRQTQTWLHLLMGQPGDVLVEDLPEAAVAPAAGSSLLQAVQAGISTLQDLAAGSLVGAAAPDGSLEIHVCHSLTRELEVLQDRLLTLFADDHPPEPADILVAVPDLETAAPLIEQVFGNAPRPLFIPYTISGLPASALNPLARALLGVLQLAGSRLPLSSLLSVLQEPCVSARFGIAPDSMEDVAELLRNAGVRWGYDAAHRTQLGLPETALGTLDDGLERLWLAHALPDGHLVPWQEHLPAALAGPPDVALLHSLDQFHARLGLLRQRLARALGSAEWLNLLDSVMADFMAIPREQSDLRDDLLAALRSHALELADAGIAGTQPVEVLLRALRDGLAGSASGGVPAGAVTFAALPSLRLLPHRVVCLLGLDDGAFPASQRPLEFDLIAASPRPGDRQRGEDERNLFLDLLLAARQTLHLSYSGRSARDNSVRPPSVLLAQLLDALVPALCPAGADLRSQSALREQLLHLHPLQPFDAAYFGVTPDGHPALARSHRTDLAAALRQRARSLAATPLAAVVATDPGQLANACAGGDEDEAETGDGNEILQVLASQSRFFPAALPALEPEWRQLDLPRLVRFFQHPARALLRDRLGMRLPDYVTVWDDAEAFLPDRRYAARLAQRLLPSLLMDPDCGTPALKILVDADGGFPGGALGALALEAELVPLRAYARAVSALQRQPAQPSRPAELELTIADASWRLSGVVEGLRDGVQGGWQYADRQPRQELMIWLRHLWACAHASQDAPATLWLLRGTVMQLRPLAPDAARAELQRLTALYAEGMCRPLPFYPRSARALVAENAAKARSMFQGSPGHAVGEGADPAWQIALRGVTDPLGSEFESLARQVWGPLLECSA